MKICQLLHAMTTGGAEVLADRMGRHFARKNDVVFACLDGIGELGEKLRSDGFVVAEFGRGQGLDVGCMRRLSRFFSDQRVDVIHAHQYTPFVYAVAARMMSTGQPVVFTEHGRFHPDLPSRKRAIFNRLMLRRRDRVIAVGRQVKQALIDNESIPETRIDVIYNGIDLTPFHNADRGGCRARLRSELELPESAMIVAQVARLDPIKDHLTAVRAMALAVKESSDLHHVIVGDGPERRSIESEIERLGIHDHVHMLGLRSDVPNVICGSDALLLTSVSEGIPLTLIEGMAGGLPCLSTDVGGVGEVITDGQTGILVPPSNPDELANALVKVGSQPKLREQLSENGVAEAKLRFDEQQMMRLYDELLGSLAHT